MSLRGACDEVISDPSMSYVIADEIATGYALAMTGVNEFKSLSLRGACDEVISDPSVSYVIAMTSVQIYFSSVFICG